MFKLHGEPLEPRNPAASLLLSLDWIYQDQRTDQPPPIVQVGEPLTAVIVGQADYEPGEAPADRQGVFAGWGDVSFTAPFDLTETAPGPQYGNVAHFAEEEEISAGLARVRRLGGALSDFGPGGVFLSGENPVDLAFATFEAGEIAGLAGIALDPTDTTGDPDPNFFAPLLFGGLTERVTGIAVPGDSSAIFQIVPLEVERHNEANPTDVDHSGRTVPLDVLLILNDLDEHGPRTIEQAVADGTLPEHDLDVEGDGDIDLTDALAAIGFLNAQ